MGALTEANREGPNRGREACRGRDDLILSPLREEISVPAETPGQTRSSVAQARDSMRETLDNIVKSGAADQMRGYANQAMGKTKLTLGMATQSPNLTLSGLAQIVVGEFQKSIGEAKLADDEEDIFPGL